MLMLVERRPCVHLHAGSPLYGAEQVATTPSVVKSINIRTMTKEDATFKVRSACSATLTGQTKSCPQDSLVDALTSASATESRKLVKVCRSPAM